MGIFFSRRFISASGTTAPVLFCPTPETPASAMSLHHDSLVCQSRNGPHPRVAAQTQLSVHFLKFFPPQERHSQETVLEYQCPVRLGHLMASCQTQVYSKTCSPDLDLHTVSKPSGTLDHHPRLRIKHEGKVRTDQNAQIQRWRTHSLLCSSPFGQQHPGAFPHSVPQCY